jgi:hypothetical protein
VPGLRVHLTGSAATACDGELLAKAHEYVSRLARALIERGHGLVLTATGEPTGSADLPCIFDWTAFAAIAAGGDPAPGWPPLRSERFVAVGTQRGLQKIPEDRRSIWEHCQSRSDFELVVAPPGWRMAGIIRDRQVARGDVLLVLGGGAGGEHLAELYRDEGKPVIALHAELGALNDDGRGGGTALHESALTQPGDFFRLRDGVGNPAGRLTALRLNSGTDVGVLVQATCELIDELRPPPAFFVRLLDTDAPDYSAVERFFREVVDDVVISRGFTPHEMGRGRPESAFMNVAIFQALHRAALVVVDLTGARPNCTMELGYALGRRRRCVISAQTGTRLPFDQDKLPTYFWKNGSPVDERRKTYVDWLDRYSELPPIVT